MGGRDAWGVVVDSEVERQTGGMKEIYFEKVPAVGRAVHYFFEDRHYAATVIQVDDVEKDIVSLAVLYFNGVTIKRFVPRGKGREYWEFPKHLPDRKIEIESEAPPHIEADCCT